MFRRGLMIVAALFALTLANARAADEENPIVTLVKSKVKDKTKPFGMTVTFKVKAGQEKAFAEAFEPCAAATRKEAGNLGYALNHDLDDPSLFMVYEKFKSIAAIEEHAKSKHVEELLKKIGPMLDGSPTVKVYVPVAD
jgi:quinol monooxygenase YgiN